MWRRKKASLEGQMLLVCIESTLLVPTLLGASGLRAQGNICLATV